VCRARAVHHLVGVQPLFDEQSERSCDIARSGADYRGPDPGTAAPRFFLATDIQAASACEIALIEAKIQCDEIDDLIKGRVFWSGGATLTCDNA
jgi:hypothetical protein